MKYTSVFVVLLMVSLVSSLAAQTGNPKGEMNVARYQLRAEKKALVTENMELNQDEAKAFWPVYEEYQAEQKAIGDRMVKLIETYSITRTVMSDETAAGLLEEFVSIQADRVKLQEEYLPKFKEVLPITKVLRYYQIENKFLVAVDYDVTSKIPLTE